MTLTGAEKGDERMREILASLRRLRAGEKVDHYELVRLKTQLNKLAKVLFAGVLFGWIFSPLLVVAMWGCVALVLMLEHRYHV